MVSLLRAPESSSPPTAYHLGSQHAKMTTMMHNYDQAMQEYMDLQTIRNQVCSHLDQLRPVSLSTVTSASSTLSSPDTSPTRDRRHHRQRAHARCSGFDETSDSLDTIPDEETLEEISLEERRLFDVDESIKRALTELLNCESVRASQSMRLWVQSRLMETEKELRSGRRRRSSATD